MPPHEIDSSPSTIQTTPIPLSSIVDITNTLGISFSETELPQWHKIIGSIQKSIDDVTALPDYVPAVDTIKYPRKNVHRPLPEDNTGNGWAWKVQIDGAEEGPLKGMTFCIKDNAAVKDVPMLFGTDVFTDYIPDIDATVVTRILEAGGTIMGKAVCENLSFCASSFSAATGPVHNPYAHGFTTGGSSSGCGALVGAGVVDAGIGGDQGGSIRFPAAYCGIVGLKPTNGLVPYTGISTHDPVHDTTGPMTKTVAECARVLQVIAGRDGIDDRQYATPLPVNLPNYSMSLDKGVKGLKIGILKEGFEFDVMDPRVKEKVLDAAYSFRNLGAEVVEISVPIHRLAGSLGECAITPAAAVQGYLGKACGRRGLYMNSLIEKKVPLTQDKFDKMFALSKYTLVAGMYIWENHPSIYGKAMNNYRRLQDAYDEALGKVDVFITPTTPYIANRHPPENAGPMEQLGMATGVEVNTTCFNASGHPAMSIPVGMLPSKETGGDAPIMLPVGMQIVGKWFDEEMVFRVGAAWERANDWKR